MSSAAQIYSFPAQLGRRGTTAVVVVGLHVVMAVGLILGMKMRPPITDEPHYPPPTVQPHAPDPLPLRRLEGSDDTGYHQPTIDRSVPPPIDVSPPDAAPVDNGPPIAVPGNPAPAPVSQVHVLRGEQPLYPASARRLGEHGTVVVRVRVGADGRPEAVEVASSSGSKRLDESALGAVRHWVFAPAQTTVGPIVSWVTFKVTFRLTD